MDDTCSSHSAVSPRLGRPRAPPRAPTNGEKRGPSIFEISIGSDQMSPSFEVICTIEPAGMKWPDDVVIFSRDGWWTMIVCVTRS
eukprot:COSAG05_NODE_60_length_23142_cov_25.372130_20_plen_85_part_00